ncbi:myb-related transcription factor, partner of profilin-like [Pseudophryne corroboree]|uniref:myb-related transcription factor, partner of profilin-like n=1 Tax=Pseudophryne corroboree TaxID=495146 RepID=UPI0030819BF1
MGPANQELARCPGVPIRPCHEVYMWRCFGMFGRCPGISGPDSPPPLSSLHPSEELSLHSNEEWDTTDQACSDQPRSSRDQMEKSKKKKKPRKARSQPEEQSEEEASGEDAGPKKPRGPRYTEAGNCALVDGVDRSYNVLYGPRAQTTAAKTKRNIWDAIARQVAAVSGNRRSTRNCMKRYSDCRRQTKKKMGIQRRHETATGGGPALNLKWLSWEDVIKRRMNPVMVQGVHGGVDSSRPAGFPEEEEPPGRRRETSSPKGGLMVRIHSDELY